MATTALDTAFAALTAAVAGEREAAGGLAYRLTTIRLLLDADEPHLLPEGLAELEIAAAQREAAGRRREQGRRDLAGPLGLDPDQATLDGLAAHAPASWTQRLTDHGATLRDLVSRIAGDVVAIRAGSERALADVRHRLGAGGRQRHLEPLPSEGQRQLIADLDLASFVTELRVQEITYEGIVDVSSDLLPDDLLLFLDVPLHLH